MFHSDRIIHKTHLNDIERAVTPGVRPLSQSGGPLRTALAAVTTLAAAAVVLFGTGLVG